MEWLFEEHDCSTIPTDGRGLMPLHLAVQAGAKSAVAWLLERGADVETRKPPSRG
jgi:hypothetical protein